MYETHFGLNRRLFEGVAQDADVFASRGHGLMAARFELALTAPDAVVTVSGPPGIGKTTLTSATLRASSTRLAIAWLNGTPTNGTELLELLLLELGLNAHRATRIERLQQWRQFQNEIAATASRLFVVVERTEDFDPAVLHALDGLTAADANGSAGANIVLLGHTDLEGHLAPAILESLRQRIRVRLKLEPFTEAELEDYVAQHVTRAGGTLDRLFAPGALAALHRYSGGIARAANHLLETALALAASEGATALTEALITRTASDILGARVPSDGESSEEPTRAPVQPPTVSSRPFAATTLPAPSFTIANPIAWWAAMPTVAEPGSAVAGAPAPAAPTTPTAAVAAEPTPTLAAEPTPTLAANPAPAVTAEPTPATEPKPTTASRVEPVPAGVDVSTQATVAPAPATHDVSARAELPAIERTARDPLATADASRAPRELLISPPSRPAPSPAPLPDFDATMTDIPDVSLTDFPVLTDAVDEPPPPRAAEPLLRTPPPSPAIVPPRAPAPRVSPSSTSRIDTAYAKRTPAPQVPAASKPVETPTPPSPPAPASAPALDDEHDVLKQTQTMRALATAKSIDDISQSMAETLFGDADLEMFSAALASAGWSEDEPQAPAPEAPPPKPEAKKRPETQTVDDSFDLFDLGNDAPLELLDDFDEPQSSRHAGGRR